MGAHQADQNGYPQRQYPPAPEHQQDRRGENQHGNTRIQLFIGADQGLPKQEQAVMRQHKWARPIRIIPEHHGKMQHQ